MACILESLFVYPTVVMVTDMDSSDEDDQDKSTNTYSGKAVGPYDNGDRALFENEVSISSMKPPYKSNPKFAAYI